MASRLPAYGRFVALFSDRRGTYHLTCHNLQARGMGHLQLLASVTGSSSSSQDLRSPNISCKGPCPAYFSAIVRALTRVLSIIGDL